MPWHLPFPFVNEAAGYILIHIFFEKKIVFHIPGQVVQNSFHCVALDADKFFFPLREPRPEDGVRPEHFLLA